MKSHTTQDQNNQEVVKINKFYKIIFVKFPIELNITF